MYVVKVMLLSMYKYVCLGFFIINSAVDGSSFM